MTAPPVRVGLNLLWLVPGEVGGSETFATGLLGALAGRDGVAPVVYCTAEAAEARPELGAHEVVTVRLDNRRRVARIAAEASWLPARRRRDRIDVMHHLGGTLPAVAPGHTVLTVYDLQPLERPEAFAPAKRAYLATQLPRSVRAASAVTTLTEGVRRQIVERFAVDPAKVVAIPPAIPLPEISAPVHTPCTPPRKFPQIVLYPAIAYEHKNHVTLLRAFAVALARRPELRLVLTGGPGPCDGEVSALIDDLDLGEAVERAGRVSEERLADLYATATAVAFPSRYEGFGLPVVEAMAAGCPVVASDATVLPEVVGDAGTLVDADDVGGWARALLALASDPDLAERHRVAGRRRAERWHPDPVAARWVELYGRIAAV